MKNAKNTKKEVYKKPTLKEIAIKQGLPSVKHTNCSGSN